MPSLALWSGPRNISTAMMRSFGSRADTVVCDEPFYAHYLAVTGRDHPGRDEILAHHDADWRRVAAWLTGPVPEGKAVFYQKHMAHHLLDDMLAEPAWLDALQHGFLVREPRAVVASLAKVLPNPSLEETGFPQQVALFRRERARTGRTPPVVDAADVLRDPRGTLSALCAAFDIPFHDAMLRWAPGRRTTDGVWARHWYARVEASTGFEAPREEAPTVPAHLEAVAEAAQACYDELAAARLAPER